MSHEILGLYNSIIILDGVMPSPAALNLINWDKPVIAADGALLKAQQHKISVDYLVGDLDTISPFLTNNYGSMHICHDPDQNSCDLEKCINFARNKSLYPTLIVGISGGEIDHILSNINILIKCHQNDGELFFLDGDDKDNIKLGFVLTKSKKLYCRPGKNISIFPYPDAVITTHGLRYPLCHAYIQQTAGILCSRNKTLKEELDIIIHQGVVLIVIDM